MPIFAAYGLLTAVMIALSLVAALAVLPSLLFLISSEPSTARLARQIAAVQKPGSSS